MSPGFRSLLLFTSINLVLYYILGQVDYCNMEI